MKICRAGPHLFTFNNRLFRHHACNSLLPAVRVVGLARYKVHEKKLIEISSFSMPVLYSAHTRRNRKRIHKGRTYLYTSRMRRNHGSRYGGSSHFLITGREHCSTSFRFPNEFFHVSNIFVNAIIFEIDQQLWSRQFLKLSFDADPDSDPNDVM